MATGARPIVTQDMKDWRTAAKATAEPDIQQKEKAFSDALAKAHVESGKVKEWRKASTEILGRYTTLTPADITDLTQWMTELFGKAKAGAWNDLQQIAAFVHQPVSNVAEGATERQRVTTWLEALGLGTRSLVHIRNFVHGFKEGGCGPKALASLWPQGDSAKCQLVLDVCSGDLKPPAWLPKCAAHRFKCTGKPTAWIFDPALGGDVLRCNGLGAWLYQGDYPSSSPDEAHAVGLSVAGLTAAEMADFTAMFAPRDWHAVLLKFPAPLQSHAKAMAKAGALCPAQRKHRTSSNLVSASKDEIGRWIVHYRDLVVKILEVGYSPQAIAAMYAEGFAHRELITFSWFRQEPIVIGNDTYVGLKIRNSSGDTNHGRAWAQTGHLAQRHLYKHFDFGQIKAQNSFHPRNTEQKDLADFANDYKNSAAEGQEDQVQLVNGMCVVISGKNANAKIASLYPDLGQNHPDYYTENKLTRIRNVLALVSPGAANKLPELDWSDRQQPDPN